MTDLFLVRHGQAAFGTDDYDRLTELGKRQAQQLGQHWQQLGWQFDRACSGEMLRQQDTARHSSGAEDHQLMSGFNEYDSKALFEVYGADFSRDDLYRSNRHFQQALDNVVRQWIGDSLGNPQLESWQQFSQRVEQGLDRLMAEAEPNDKVVVFTSAGAIARTLMQVLSLETDAFLAINARIFNTSVTHIRYGRTGYAMLGFNDVSHLRLKNPDWVTFR